MLLTGSAFIFPVQVKYGSDRKAETKNENGRSNFVFQYLTKTEMTIRILLSKVVGKQKTKTDGSNSIFNVVGKRKRNLEFRFPMTWVNEERKCKFEFRFPISQENGWH